MLSVEERNDLRKKVLRGEQMTLEEAREVFASIRQGAAIANAGPGESEKKPRKGTKKPGISDAELDDQLKDLGIG